MSVPPEFVFTDLAAANAEVDRLHRSCAILAVAFADICDVIPENILPRVEPIVDALSDAINAIVDEREAAQ